MNNKHKPQNIPQNIPRLSISGGSLKELMDKNKPPCDGCVWGFINSCSNRKLIPEKFLKYASELAKAEWQITLSGEGVKTRISGRLDIVVTSVGKKITRACYLADGTINIEALCETLKGADEVELLEMKKGKK
ncbi:MAG: hypothetical protein J6Y54_05630 [Lentisphaeria bacterium]|nr:hypothetical protein [Lentisphaeria bacterium]